MGGLRHGAFERPDLRTAGGIGVGVPLVLMLVLFAAADAGFSQDVWLPAAALVLGLFALVVFMLPQLLRGVPRASAVASISLFAFAGWCFVSIAWADARGIAWDGANRTLFYALLYALVAVWPWRTGTAALVLGGFTLGVAVIGVATGVAVLLADDPTTFFIGPLLSEPAGYHNANSALFLLAFWPALLLASRPEMPTLLRPVFLGAACLHLQLALLCQSRGSLYTFPLSAVVYFAIVPGRLRSAVALAPVAAVTLLALEPLLDVYRELGTSRSEAVVDDAAAAIVVSVLGVAAAGLIVALVDRRIAVPARVRTVASRLALTLLAGAVVVGAFAVARADPIDRADEAWGDFKRYKPDVESGSHFASGLGSNRYDFWRVALGQFTAAPLHGIGVDNFAIAYVRERRSDEEPLYPHSVGFGVLSQTGVVGAGLLASFVGAAFAAAWGGRRSRRPLARGMVAAGIAMSAYFALHAGGDWLWELPGLACIALTALALPAGLARGDPPAGPNGGRLGRILAGAAGALALLSFAFPWAAAQQTQAAEASWRSDAGRAYSGLERARALNPLSETPDLAAGAIASRLRDWGRMRRSFGRALERNPRSWYAELELAVAEAQEGNRVSALRHLEVAARLNPREPAIGLVRSRLRSGRPLDPDAIDRLFLRRVEDRTR